MVDDERREGEGSEGSSRSRNTSRPRAKGVAFKGGRSSPPQDAPKEPEGSEESLWSERGRSMSKRTPPPSLSNSPTNSASGVSGALNRQQFFKRSKSAPMSAPLGGRSQHGGGVLPIMKRAASSSGFGPPSPERGPLATNRRRLSKQAVAAQQAGDYDPALFTTASSPPAAPASPLFVHAFIDNTNTFSQVPRRSSEQMARRLHVGERGRPLASRIVVGSARSVDALCTWVSRYKELGCHEVYMDVLGDGLGGKESIVDDTLHANIVLTILRAELEDVTATASAPLAVAPRRVMVLYSGDTNENHGRVSFPECVELALSCGWAVEVIHKMPSLTAASYLNRSASSIASLSAVPLEPLGPPTAAPQLSPWGRALQTFDMRESHTISPTSSIDELYPFGSTASDDGSLSPPRKPHGSMDELASQGDESGRSSSTSGPPTAPLTSLGGEGGTDGGGKMPALPCRPVGDKLIADVEEMNRVWVQLQQASEAEGESLDDIRGRVDRMVSCLNALVEEVKRERSSPAPRRAFEVTERIVGDTTAYLSKCPGARVLRNELRRQLRKAILPEGTYQNGCVDLVIEALEDRGLAFVEGVGAKTEVVLFPQAQGGAAMGTVMQGTARCTAQRGRKTLLVRQQTSSSVGEEDTEAAEPFPALFQAQGRET